MALLLVGRCFEVWVSFSSVDTGISSTQAGWQMDFFSWQCCTCAKDAIQSALPSVQVSRQMSRKPEADSCSGSSMDGSSRPSRRPSTSSQRPSPKERRPDKQAELKTEAHEVHSAVPSDLQGATQNAVAELTDVKPESQGSASVSGEPGPQVHCQSSLEDYSYSPDGFSMPLPTQMLAPSSSISMEPMAVREDAQPWPYVTRKIEPATYQRITAVGPTIESTSIPVQRVTVLTAQQTLPLQRVAVQSLAGATAVARTRLPTAPVSNGTELDDTVAKREMTAPVPYTHAQVLRRETTAPASLAMTKLHVPTPVQSFEQQSRQQAVTMAEPAVISASMPPPVPAPNRELEARRMVTRMLSAPAPTSRSSASRILSAPPSTTRSSTPSARVSLASYERQHEALNFLPTDSHVASPAASTSASMQALKLQPTDSLVASPAGSTSASIARSVSPLVLLVAQQQAENQRLSAGCGAPIAAATRGRAGRSSTPPMVRKPPPRLGDHRSAMMRRTASADPRASYAERVPSPGFVPLAVEVPQISRSHELKRVNEAQKLLRGMLTPSPPLTLLESGSAPGP